MLFHSFFHFPVPSTSPNNFALLISLTNPSCFTSCSFVVAYARNSSAGYLPCSNTYLNFSLASASFGFCLPSVNTFQPSPLYLLLKWSFSKFLSCTTEYSNALSVFNTFLSITCSNSCANTSVIELFWLFPITNFILPSSGLASPLVLFLLSKSFIICKSIFTSFPACSNVS